MSPLCYCNSASDDNYSDDSLLTGTRRESRKCRWFRVHVLHKRPGECPRLEVEVLQLLNSSFQNVPGLIFNLLGEIQRAVFVSGRQPMDVEYEYLLMLFTVFDRLSSNEVGDFEAVVVTCPLKHNISSWTCVLGGVSISCFFALNRENLHLLLKTPVQRCNWRSR